MKDILGIFINNIFYYITGKNVSKGSLIKKHSEKLETNGDLSFPYTSKSWHEHKSNFVKHIEDADILKCLGKSIQDLKNESLQWCLSISEITMQADRYFIYLNRIKTIEQCLLIEENNCNLLFNKLQNSIGNVICDTYCEQSNSLTALRVRCIKKAIENLCNVILTNYSSYPLIFVTNKTSNLPQNYHLVLCGSVLNAKTGTKEKIICSNKYIQ